MRRRGLFGAVSVSWVVEPSLSGDVSPFQGTITFKDGEDLKNLTLFSVPDEVRLLHQRSTPLVVLRCVFSTRISVSFKIPEAMENFTVTAVKAEGGARLGKILNASLQILKNDDPVFFSGKGSFLREERYII